MNIALIIVAILVIAIGYIIYLYRKLKNQPEVEKSVKIKDLTDNNFNQQIRNNITLVDFWAPWCMPCKVMAPILNEIAEQVDSKVQIAKVNIDENQPLAAKYNIRSIPTTVLFRNGKEVNRFVGVKTKNFLLEHINSLQ